MREVKVYEARSLYCQDTEQLASGFMGKFDVVLKADHDAALRRAKAEVWREAAQQVTQLMIQPKGILDGDTLLAIIDRLDARAAQIENEATK